MKTICVTMTSQERKGLWVTIDNLMQYCKRHKYDIEIIEIGEDNKWEYRKHEVFKELLEDYDVIFYKDDDAIITNLNTPIEKFLVNGKGYYVTKDATEINNGVVIVTKDSCGGYINDAILANRNSFQNEQNVLNYYHEQHPQWNEWIKILPHPSINSYKYELYPECKDYVGKHELGDWKEGDFILHVPALGLDKRIEVLKSVKAIE